MKKSPLLLLLALPLLGAGCAAPSVPVQPAPSPYEAPPEPFTLMPFSSDAVHVTAPLELEEISSPVSITGEALGTWFFEATLPVVVKDGNGAQIGQGYVTATADWMTTGFVPFEGTITFTSPTTTAGTIVFQKDNPSGEPANDDEREMDITFAP